MKINNMIILLIIADLILFFISYMLWNSLIQPELERKRQIWQKVEANFKDLEKPL